MPALACPTIATGTPSQLNFDTAQVVVVRQGERTTFSVSINPQGDSQAFALVMPVPELLAGDQIRIIDADIFAELNGYTAPRHVPDAGCGYSRTYGYCGDSGGMAMEDGEAGGGGYSDVEIEASYLVGSYEITILSAEESGELNRWLDDHGYYLPDGARERLEEYIEAGSYFMVAKVSEEAQLADGSPLTPLQVSYNSPVFAIPIRLAALSAIEEQDMVIYTLTDYDQGQVAISNYPQATLNGGCIWDKDSTDFTAFYEGEVDRAMAAEEGAAWISEFSFDAGNCNPCTDYYFSDPARFEELGFQGVDEGGWPWVTRLRVRYSKETADQDLTLYSSSMQPQTTMSFADDSEGNRYCIESYCDGTDAEDPPAPEPIDCEEGGLSDEDEEGFKGGMGCATAPSAGLFSALGALAALGLRRRRA
jgi:hypothetical protein